jgi:energy-coupling factor transport system permease protein
VKARICYREGNSALHALYPLVKLAWLIYLTVFVFISPHVVWVLAVVLLTVCLYTLNRLSLRDLRGGRLLLTTALLLAFLQLVFNKDGVVWINFGPLQVTSTGVEMGLYVAARFLSVVLASYLFVLTTNPNDLAYALIRAGLPYRYGFTLVTAIRLAPVFENEAAIVYQAQLARGVRYDRSNWRRLLTLARQFTLPMLVSALSKVDALAISMEGRCFGKYRRRTFLRQVRFTWPDFISLALLLCLCALTILYL